MAVNSLLPGRHTLTQNTIYALPPRRCLITSDAALEVSNVEAFTTSQAITADTPTEPGGTFVRCTVGAAVVNIKA